MRSIKCDTCLYLGGRHEKGVIPIQSGAIPIDEAYATCLKRQYFVLEREVEKCKDYKSEKEQKTVQKGNNPYRFTKEELFAIIKSQKWITFDEICSQLKITEKSQIRYLPLMLKSLINKKKVKMKLGANKLLYSIID